MCTFISRHIQYYIDIIILLTQYKQKIHPHYIYDQILSYHVRYHSMYCNKAFHTYIVFDLMKSFDKIFDKLNVKQNFLTILDF